MRIRDNEGLVNTNALRGPAAYHRHHERLRRIVAGMGFTHSDADDILQDVYVAASENVARDQCHAERWLVRVTLNRCLLEYRRRERFRRSAERVLLESRNTEQPNEAPDTQASLAEELDAVRRALREMDGALTTAVVLRYFCGYDATRIGEFLDVSPSTVRSRLRAARMWLADRLRQRGEHT